jgi:hypothetical protein
MADDLVRMYRTLETLARNEWDRSFAGFLADCLGDGDDRYAAIRRTATALSRLTYDGRSYDQATLQEGFADAAQRAANFAMPAQAGDALYGRKRLWCSLRDYLKSAEFNRELVAALQAAGLATAETWARNNGALRHALHALELPGDVWNNAFEFRAGLFLPYLTNVPGNWDMPRIIRAIYNRLRENQELQFHPEQLDVSFDFVPRMCQRNQCDVCPFGGGVEQLCHQHEDLLCPVTLACCGYRYRCSPANCPLRENRTRGFCHQNLAGGVAPD